MPDTPTSRLQLYKSASDGSEDVNYTQDLGNNLDKLDLAVGALACTSSTRPSTPWNGQLIRETDTNRLWVSNGSAPASGSWKEICTPGAAQTFTAAVTMSAGLTLNGAASTTTVAQAGLAADTNRRITIDASGKLTWGSGATAGDTTLYRSAADTLKTDDAFVVGGNLTASNFSVILDWTTPAMATGYTSDGNGNGIPQYRVINLLGTKFVQWRGGIGVTYSGGSPVNSGMPFSAAVNSLAMPTSTRTATAACSATSSTSLSVKVDFTTSGGVTVITSTGVQPPWVSLNDIMYSV